MLYEQWRRTAGECRDHIALIEWSTGKRWTFSELFREGERQLPPREPVVFARGAGAEFMFGVLSAWRWGRVLCPLEPTQVPPEIKSTPPACVHLKLTSATGGTARMVAFRGEQLMADAENIVSTMGLRPEWPNIGAISLAHSYGFSNLVLPLLLHGIPLVLVEAPLPETVRSAADLIKAVTLPGVPALWRVWHEAGAITQSIRLAISAGAPLPLPLEQAVFSSARVKIHNFYGSSECGGIAYDRTNVPRSDAACVGSPMDGVNLSISNHGCLEVRSKAVAEAYWPQANENLGSGRFQTSDLAEIIDGNIYLRGRAGDQINVAGRKVSPEAIERVLLRHPLVRECLVFGVPVPDERVEMIVACVAGSGVAADPLRQFLLAELPAWQVPREFWLVDSLQTNMRGKILRSEWRSRFLEQRLGNSRQA